MAADFQQFYGVALPLNLDECADPARMAALWMHLPRESRVVRRRNPHAEWGDAEYLLRAIEYSIRALVWAQTKDAERGRNRPEPLQSPGERAEHERRRDSAIEAKSEIDQILGITEGVFPCQ